MRAHGVERGAALFGDRTNGPPRSIPRTDVGDRTLGDRVQAVLLQGVKPVAPVAPVAAADDPALAATRNWGAQAPARGVAPPPPAVEDEIDATTRALPERPAALAAPPHPPPRFRSLLSSPPSRARCPCSW